MPSRPPAQAMSSRGKRCVQVLPPPHNRGSDLTDSDGLFLCSSVKSFSHSTRSTARPWCAPFTFCLVRPDLPGTVCLAQPGLPGTFWPVWPDLLGTVCVVQPNLPVTFCLAPPPRLVCPGISLLSVDPMTPRGDQQSEPQDVGWICGKGHFLSGLLGTVGLAPAQVLGAFFPGAPELRGAAVRGKWRGVQSERKCVLHGEQSRAVDKGANVR